MAANESSRGSGNMIVVLAALVILGGIGFSFWPKIKAAYYATPDQQNILIATQQPAQPDTGKAEVDRLKAQVAAMQAQLAADRSKVVVQTVQQGEAPQQVAAPAQQPAEVQVDTSSGNQPSDAVPAEPPARPIVIVDHQTDYGHPVITGSGACAVATGARRCSK